VALGRINDLSRHPGLTRLRERFSRRFAAVSVFGYRTQQLTDGARFAHRCADVRHPELKITRVTDTGTTTLIASERIRVEQPV
jgi:hypothetical protein